MHNVDCHNNPEYDNVTVRGMTDLVKEYQEREEISLVSIQFFGDGSGRIRSLRCDELYCFGSIEQAVEFLSKE